MNISNSCILLVHAIVHKLTNFLFFAVCRMSGMEIIVLHKSKSTVCFKVYVGARVLTLTLCEIKNDG